MKAAFDKGGARLYAYSKEVLPMIWLQCKELGGFK